ncbi:MAG TPA: sigma-70 family RNA polymerase sigma factor [Polyangia bacterium]|nr:sigma-70 family RNA polymerase sigma factor [Polyangia bacterium]
MDHPDDGLAQVMLAAFSSAWTSLTTPGGPLRAPVPPEVGPALEELFSTGQRQWPDLPVDAAALAAHLARQIPSDTADFPAALGTISGAADLYLAVACATGVPGALEAFDRSCAAAINGTIAAIDRAPSFRTDVRQALHERLFVGSADAPARIGTYAGRGPLAAWVAIVTQRLALLMRRTEQNRARIEDRAASEPLPQPDDPELAYLKQRYRDEFKAAYRAALEALSERDRTLLRLHLFEGVTLERLGAMYGVNASTVSRWIEKARAAIRDTTQARLRDQLRVSTGEFASLARLVVSQLDVSIMALFEQPRPHQS